MSHTTRRTPTNYGLASVVTLVLLSCAPSAFAGWQAASEVPDEYVKNGDMRSGNWMDCATFLDQPSITLYESSSLDSEGEYMTVRNDRVLDFRDYSIYVGNQDPPDADNQNDAFNSLAVNGGSWQICEDINLGGECKIVKGGRYHAAALGSLAGEISSMVPVGCTDDQAGTIIMSKEHLRKPDNSTKTTSCLHHEEGNIANNGLVHLKWTNGKLSLVENVSHGVLWKTNTSGDNTLCFDADAKLEITDSSGAVLWHGSAGTHDPDTRLIVKDCEVKLVHGSTTYWHSDTRCD